MNLDKSTIKLYQEHLVKKFKSLIDEMADEFTEKRIKSMMNSPIFEMAELRSKAESKCRDLGEEIYEHLIKILYWEDDVNYKKHIKDIDGWLNKLERIILKPNNKPIKSEYYLDWLYESPFGGSTVPLSVTIKALKKEYGELPETGITIDELFKKFNILYAKLSKDLSDKTFNSIEDYL